MFVSVCVQYRCRELYSLALYPFRALTSCVVVTFCQQFFSDAVPVYCNTVNWQKNWWIKNCGRGGLKSVIEFNYFFRPSVVLDITHFPKCIFVSWIVIAGTQSILWWGEQKSPRTWCTENRLHARGTNSKIIITFHFKVFSSFTVLNCYYLT
jgi:hypothetical protein